MKRHPTFEQLREHRELSVNHMPPIWRWALLWPPRASRGVPAL
jgi:hypothetical protein